MLVQNFSTLWAYLYSQKYWWELNVMDGPPITIAKILNLVIQEGITICITFKYEILPDFKLAVAEVDCQI